MKLFSRLAPNRYAEGSLWVLDDTARMILGPERARGEADNTGAAAHGNVQEDPTQAFGDHPGGVFRVTEVVWGPTPPDSYGPCFLRLQPVSGEAWEARVNGRSGFGIHGGRLHADGRLRETYGCLRVDDPVAEQLGKLVAEELAAGREVFYECVIESAAA